MRFPCMLMAVAVAVPVPMIGTARACYRMTPPIAEIVDTVGTKGAVFAGTVVQAYDARRGQRLQIRADTVFVGDPALRIYTLSYAGMDKAAWERAARKIPSCPPDAPPGGPIGFSDIFILVPETPGGPDGALWRARWYDERVRTEKGAVKLEAVARGAGRFQASIPRVDP